MRISGLILTVCFSVLALGSQEPSDRGVRPQPADAIINQGFEPYDRRVALVIGIDRYVPAVGGLSYAVRDARGVDELLRYHLGFDEVIVLEDAKATRVDILRAILRLEGDLGQEDQLLVFFAGHGVTFGEGSSEMGYLLPQDIRSLAKEDVFTAGIPMADLKSRLVALPAKHILLLVDACYSGYAAVTSRGTSRETSSESYLREITRSPARQLITAGRRDQESLESDRWGHSAFTYKVLQGLREHLADTDRNGIVTAMELATFLSESVHALTEGRQTPQFSDLTFDEGEFVFILPETPKSLEIKLSRPSKVILNGSRAQVLDPLGQTLWIHTADAELQVAEITDLDGDGAPEVAMGFGGEGRGRIDVLDYRGEFRWSSEPPAMSPLSGAHSNRMAATYMVSGAFRGEGRQQLAVVWNDAGSWPRALVGILDESGTLISTYWNPGQLKGAQLVSTGPDAPLRLLVYGFNNDLARSHAGEGRLASLAMLNTRNMDGQAPPRRGSHDWYAVLSPRPAEIEGAVVIPGGLTIRLKGGRSVALHLDGRCIEASCDENGVDLLLVE